MARKLPWLLAICWLLAACQSGDLPQVRTEAEIQTMVAATLGASFSTPEPDLGEAAPLPTDSAPTTHSSAGTQPVSIETAFPFLQQTPVEPATPEPPATDTPLLAASPADYVWLPWFFKQGSTELIPFPGLPYAPETEGIEYLEFVPLPEDSKDAQGKLAEKLRPYLATTARVKVVETSASLDEVEALYTAQLPQLGWEWLYTDAGESLINTTPGPVLLQEYRRPDSTLSVAAMPKPGKSGAPTGKTLLFLAERASAGEVLFAYNGIRAEKSEITRPDPSAALQNAMKFTSPWIQFRHPSNWLATGVLRYTFPGDNAQYVFPEPRRCPGGHPSCFVNFALLTDSLYTIPVSIRVYQGAGEITLDEFDVSRARELQNKSVGDPESWSQYSYPEDLAITGSMRMSERHVFSFRDGTSARQRIYTWRQANQSQPMASTYTLFRKGDVFVEFHTDFSQPEWERIKKDVNSLISYMGQ